MVHYRSLFSRLLGDQTDRMSDEGYGDGRA
jgi:hypothetical protein